MIASLSRSLFLVALAHLSIEFCNNFLPIVYPTFIDRMELSYTQVGFIALVAGTSTTLMQPLFGYLGDRWQSHRWLSVGSVLWIGLIMGLVGFADSYPVLVLLVGLGGLGSAAFHPAGAVLASASGGQRRGTAMSIFSVGGNVGTALSPLWVMLGIGWFGLAGTSVVIPVAGAVALLLYWQLIRSGRFNVAVIDASAQPEKRRRSPRGELAGMILITIAVMCRSWFQVTLVTYLPEWLQSQGQTMALSGQILSVFLVSLGAGSLSGGILSDRVGRWQIFVLSLGLLSVVHWLFMLSGQWWLVAVIGVLTGATFPVGVVMAQEAWPRQVGLASALVIGLGWAPGGLGASVTGFLADRFSLDFGLQSLVIPPLVGVGCVLVYAFYHRLSEPGS